MKFNKKVKFFCFPCAGGSVNIYNQWNKYLHKNIDLQLIELKGRGKRYREPFYKNFNEIIEDLYTLINKDIEELPFAFFGHSMGSLIAFELAYKIFEVRGREPECLFFSGRMPPDIKVSDISYHLLPDYEFKLELKKLGGIPEAFCENSDLYNFFIPIIKNDFFLLSTYQYREKVKKLTCRFDILYGQDDYEITSHEMTKWNKHTLGECKIRIIPGGHFYLFDNEYNMANLINSVLA